MLSAPRRRILVLMEHGGNIVCHGEVYGAIDIVPIDRDAAI